MTDVMGESAFNKLHEIKPVLGKNTMYRSLRREEVVLTRLRIGHTRLTHSYLLEREDQPLCISCTEPFTVKYFLIDCFEFSQVRRQFFKPKDLRYLFEDVPADNTRTIKRHQSFKQNITLLIFKFSTILTFYAYRTHYYSRFITKPS